MNRDNQNKKGFTLVELLVVIGIIAMLISILLPVLGRARWQANIIKCASNVRQLSINLQMYASQNKGFMPLSYYWNQQSNSNQIGSGLGNSGKAVPTLLGQSLQDSGILTDAFVKTMYCPLEKTQRLLFQGTSNPWPLVAYGFTMMGYGVRPLLNTYPNAGNNGIVLDTSAYYIDGSRGPNFPVKSTGIIKVTKLKSYNAIVSDCMFPSTTNERPWSHIDKGMNAAFADGSVSWVPISAYSANWKSGLFDRTTNVYYYNGTKVTGMWIDLDTYHRAG